jgi:dTDP-4-dehydrorhamnose reductase
MLITGASGQLGSYLLRELRQRDAAVTAWTGSQTGVLFGYSLQPIDLRDVGALRFAFHEARPQVVVHTAAMAAVGDCSRDPEGAMTVNATATRCLAELAAEAGARLVHVSTDLVFDGEHAPYCENAMPAPVSAYGRSKAAAERGALICPAAAIVRVSLLFGPSLTTRPTLLDRQRESLGKGQPLTLFEDEWRTPLDLETAARALLAIAASDFRGTLHVGGPERLSRLEMGQQLAAVLGCHANIVPTPRNAGQAEPRARDVSLDSSRWQSLFPQVPWPSHQNALRGMLGCPLTE